MKKLTLSDFKIPAALLALSVVPILGGVVRLTSVARDVTVTPDNARFLHAPTPVLIHVCSVCWAPFSSPLASGCASRACIVARAESSR